MQFPGVEEVEYLQPDEGVEDHGEMSGVVFGGVKGGLVISVPIYVEEPSAANVAPDDAVLPFVLGVGDIQGIGVVGVDILGDELLAHEDEDQEDCDLEDRLADDVFQHRRVDDVVVSGVGLAVEEFGGGVLGGQGDRGQTVHDEVDPKHLDWLEYVSLDQGCPYEGDADCYDIDGQLELYELPDGIVDVPSPKDCLHDGVEVIID